MDHRQQLPAMAAEPDCPARTSEVRAPSRGEALGTRATREADA